MAAAARGIAAELTPVVDRDRDLVEALQQHVPLAVDQFVSAYGSRAYRLALGITRNRPDAEEVVQDALWSAVRKIDTFRAESTFGSWFYRIVVNAAYHTLRKRGRRAEVPLDDALPSFSAEDVAAGDPTADVAATAETVADDAHLRHVLSTAIDALPPAYRGVLVLRDVEGLSNAEVAEVMHITLANAKSRVHRARMFVRRRLAPFLPAGGLEEAASRA
jgi:RNA polymerase sigma-70 factor, ECF subfamily